MKEKLDYPDYAAFVEVGKNKFYLSTYTGEGFDLVLKNMRPYIYKLAKKYLYTMPIEDAISQIEIVAIESIKKYNPFLRRHTVHKEIK